MLADVNAERLDSPDKDFKVFEEIFNSLRDNAFLLEKGFDTQQRRTVAGGEGCRNAYQDIATTTVEQL